MCENEKQNKILGIEKYIWHFKQKRFKNGPLGPMMLATCAHIGCRGFELTHTHKILEAKKTCISQKKLHSQTLQRSYVASALLRDSCDGREDVCWG